MNSTKNKSNIDIKQINDEDSGEDSEGGSVQVANEPMVKEKTKRKRKQKKSRKMKATDSWEEKLKGIQKMKKMLEKEMGNIKEINVEKTAKEIHKKNVPITKQTPEVNTDHKTGNDVE